MSLDLRRDPFDCFYMPAMHRGLSYLPPRPGWVIRPVPSARVGLHAASDHEPILEIQQGRVAVQQERMLQSVMEVNACPVVLERVEFAEAAAAIDGRYLLNGAAGDRLRTRYEVQNGSPRAQERLGLALRHARFGGPFQPPVWRGDSRQLPIALELRNGFNYYHFTYETLAALAHFADDDSGQPVTLHLRNSVPSPFMTGFVAALFPGLAPRLRFDAATVAYPAVRSVYNHRHYLYQVQDARVESMAAQALAPDWAQPGADYIARRAVLQGSFDSSQRLLRDRALRALPRRLVASMPRLIWMGRAEDGGARQRELTGAGPLLEDLRGRGFETVFFEHLAPLEQIAAMQAADVVIAPHGAGLANMLYARSDTLVIEIGNSQTQLYRWGDFLAGAHAARCGYETVFCDLPEVDVPGTPPTVRQGMLGTHVGRRATEIILALVDRALQRRARRVERGGAEQGGAPQPEGSSPRSS